MRHHAWVLGLAAACGAPPSDDDTDAADSDPTVDTDDAEPTDDDSDDVDTDPPAVPELADALDCGATGPAGGLAPGADLQRVDLDLAGFPDAVCNDGTPGFFYFRPATSEATADQWVIQLQGGGSCESPDDCFARWCSVDTAFGMQGMTATESPAVGIRGKGILSRRADNPYGDANHVFLRYCSSDVWSGDADPVVEAAHPVSGEPVTAQLHFHGRAILDAVVTMLRQDGTTPLTFTLGGADDALPDLDDATAVLLAGGSAGGAGTLLNADRLDAALRAHNPGLVELTALTDSAFIPSFDHFEYDGTEACTLHGLCDHEAWMTHTHDTLDAFVGREPEASCAAAHPTDAWRCSDNAHVYAHHVTTPLMVRMGQSDELLSERVLTAGFRIDGEAVTLLDFARLVRTDLVAFANAGDAEEKDDMVRAPAVFSPTCSDHEVLSAEDQVYDVTIDVDEEDLAMFDVFTRWRDGESPRAAIATAVDDNVCQ